MNYTATQAKQRGWFTGLRRLFGALPPSAAPAPIEPPPAEVDSEPLTITRDARGRFVVSGERRDGVRIYGKYCTAEAARHRVWQIHQSRRLPTLTEAAA